MTELNESKFIEWFKAHQPLCGKTKTMQEIVKAFPRSAFTTKQPFHPFRFHKYSTLAATLMNRLNEEGRMKTYKKGRTWCYEIKE